MARLFIHVEGQTEEEFVREILGRHLLAHGYFAVHPRIIGNPKLGRQRGGIRSWPAVKKEIVRRLIEDKSCVATMMVDFYGLPRRGAGAWPGYSADSRGNAEQRAVRVEDELRKDVAAEIGRSSDPRRFVPFIVMHEFEALLFSDCVAFARALDQPHLRGQFQEIRDQFASPEEIDDSPATAPSKRIAAIVQGYQKPLFGNLAALEIGLERMRTECPHFDRWLIQLESLGHRA